MKLQKIKIEGFKSIYEPLEIDFNDICGLWKISGSVGAGKTSIGEAIIYGLFGTVAGKNNTDLISWGRKKGIVEVWCTSRGYNLYIKREMKTYGQSPIYVEVNGEELVFSSKRDAQSQLEQEYYDVSKMSIELLCVISFNNFKSLATLNAMDTRKFLDQILGFYVLTEYSDQCKLLKTNNLNNISDIKSTIKQIESQITKIEEISNMKVIDGNIDEVKKNINKITKEYVNIECENKRIIDELNSQCKELEKKQASVVTLGKSKTKEIEFIEKGTCPTCGAPIDQSQLEEKKQERNTLLDHHASLGRDIKLLQDKIKSTNIDYENNKIKPLLTRINELKQLLTRLEEQQMRLSLNNEEITVLNQNIKNLNIKLEDYQREDTEWAQLYNILSTQVRYKIINSFIPVLNKNILKYAQRLHLPYLVQFDTNFKCCITIYGMDKEVPVSSLSTGQLKTVDMVVILGVLGTVIGSGGINILFLDELFSNLDAGLRNEMCMILRENLAADTTIFIISHTDLDDKYFDGNIYMKLEVWGQYEKHTLCKIEKLTNVDI